VTLYVSGRQKDIAASDALPLPHGTQSAAVDEGVLRLSGDVGLGTPGSADQRMQGAYGGDQNSGLRK
jgi:hypothetical protein